MDWSIRLNRAIDYIEMHLDQDMDLDQAAKLAFCSRNDLSGMFSIVAGITLNEYIRRRRLSLAALELQTSNEKIIDIGMKYGYSSPTAFNRAFQNQHKASPQYARSRNIFIAAYPRISFQITIKGEINMKCRIEKKPAFKVAGVKKTFQTNAVENRVPAFWGELPRETYNKIIAQSGGKPEGMMGLCADFDGGHQFNYYIAVSTVNDNVGDLETIEIPEATWAIFEAEGGLMELVNRVWQEWFPSSGYRRADNSIPDVEVYFDYDFPKEKYTYELWYPVIKE
ncbi:AraC family transcriptional regulator [Paenibacillus mesotrionivorans]|uniref:GyrI-like domain-containing protein n=1 Tax=Paenibacillus mesotrionivorans TaxID=3160968 RepID=A0ACC7P072_9BACL